MIRRRLLVIGLVLGSTLWSFGQTGAARTDTEVKDSFSMDTCCDHVSNYAEPEMVFVEGGVFSMGCGETNGECAKDELPVHQVALGNFYMSKYEITQGQWKAVMLENSSDVVKGKNFPVENISLDEIQVFIIRLNTATGKQFRLPTEEEWEYAARGGNQSQHYKYSGNNDINEVAWYWSNSNNGTNPVGRKQPNELGLYDMSGNVAEWCGDRYIPYAEKGKNNFSEISPESYVIRGGRWSSAARRCRILCRDSAPSSYRSPDVGFRLVLINL